MLQTNSNIGIIAGEDIDMPQDFIQKNNLKIYTFNLIWEGVLQDRNEIYRKMRENANNKEVGTPRTSQPSVGLFKELYESSLKEFNEVFVVVLSSKLSGCFNSATQAVAMLDDDKRNKVHIMESPSTSSGSAFIIQELLRLFKSNTPVEKIKQSIDAMRPQLHLVAMIEDSYWLQKGGRISPAIALIINQMKKIGIRPLLAAVDGKLALLKVRTNAKSKKQALFDYINSEIGDKKAEIIITHADNRQEADSLKTLFQENKPNAKVLYVNQLSPVLGAHVGPDSLVVGWKIIA